MLPAKNLAARLAAAPVGTTWATAPSAVQGLVNPAVLDPRYADHGLMQQDRPAVATVSFTGASAGGAPGALFGPPGVGGANVPTSLGLTQGQIILGAIAIAAVLYAVT